jgi:hypothetical protein
MIYGEMPVKILQKILMIVVGVVVAGNVNVEGMLAPPTVTVLDLPVETPGRQMISTPDHKKVFHPNLFFMRNESGQVIHYCEHIIVPNTPASIAFSERGVNAAIKSEGNIYFPADGHQPTTPDAVAWSCANVDANLPEDQRLNSPITNWYMKMFGVIPIEEERDEYIAAGFIKLLTKDKLNHIISTHMQDLVKINIPVAIFNRREELREKLKLFHDVRYFIINMINSYGDNFGKNVRKSPEEFKLLNERLNAEFKKLSDIKIDSKDGIKFNIYKVDLSKYNTLQEPMATRIISFDQSVQEEDKKAFVTLFRKIASTPVGRVLLYRLLVEIRRKKDNIQSPENGAQINDIFLENRSKSLSLVVKPGNTSYPIAFYGSEVILFSTAGTNQEGIGQIVPTIITNKQDNYRVIKRCNSNYDTDVFHEMIHWFHALREPIRNSVEKLETSIFTHYDNIAKHYFENLEGYEDDGRKDVASRVWHHILEEFRTIMGAPQNNDYLEGDDICENLYRMYISAPIRYGHGNIPFYEDGCVIDAYWDILIGHCEKYDIPKNDIDNYWNIIDKRRYEVRDGIYDINYDENEKGIGNCIVNFYYDH